MRELKTLTEITHFTDNKMKFTSSNWIRIAVTGNYLVFDIL